MDIIQELKTKVMAGAIIPKPNAKADFIVKGWGTRRGEEALIYRIPNHKNAAKPHEKGINVSEWRKVYRHVSWGEDFDKDWFSRNLSSCAEDGDCNFTTIGGVFQMLGLVYYEHGVYKSRKNSFK